MVVKASKLILVVKTYKLILWLSPLYQLIGETRARFRIQSSQTSSVSRNSHLVFSLKIAEGRSAPKDLDSVDQMDLDSGKAGSRLFQVQCVSLQIGFQPEFQGSGIQVLWKKIEKAQNNPHKSK